MAGVLETIDSPADLKKLTAEQLNTLAHEIREEIKRVVTRTGGHLGSNLGCVELTIALHFVYDFLHDRLVFDVSHQAYPHKLLTGRRKQFDTLRQYAGISGYCNKDESPYDCFTFAHAGTGISTALGIVAGDDNAGRQDRRVVALVGDGGLTCGNALEALNHCGALQKNLLVVLNDNRMSIGKTVGAMAGYLNRLRIDPLYNDLKKEVKELLQKFPMVGHPFEAVLSHLKSGVMGTLGGNLFEELGFNYFGPIDGHNIPEMVLTLKEIRKKKTPVLLHVLTEKGRGYEPAGSDPLKAHGVGPGKGPSQVCLVEKTPAAPAKKEVTYTDVFKDAMIEFARKDPRIVGLTAAMPDGTGLMSFEKVLPEKYFDVGICEQHGVGLAAGMAHAGQKPVAAIYSTFLQRAYDQVFQEIALQRSNVVLAMDRAGIVGPDGPTHNGVFDIAYLRVFPGMVLMAPRDGRELKDMLAFALAYDDGPIAIRYPRTAVPDRDELPAPPPLALGKAEVLRQGPDGALVAYGAMVYTALEAADLLAARGLEVTVVNARFAKPIDRELLTRLAAEHPFLVTLEDHTRLGGFGSTVLETLADAGADVRKVSRLAIPDQWVEHGPRNLLLTKLGLDAQGVVAEAVRRWEALGTPRRSPAEDKPLTTRVPKARPAVPRSAR
ncbi:MAG: 1-deoxy-D-xylulose-5-phosphate synthase [Planctomycetes bacterium]|nr:1-deoxy-D-xylulose-5-phosphate synthase [Planctomycetota bacterium]